jgi:hypothetical protein
MGDNSSASSGRVHFEFALQEDWDSLALMLETAAFSTNQSNVTNMLNDKYGADEPEPFTRDSSLLHVVVAFSDVPVSIVESLLQQAPSLVYTWDSLGRTPLHIAAIYSSQADVVRKLVQHAPQTALQQDETILRSIDHLCQEILMKEERSKYTHKESETMNDQGSKLNKLWSCVQPLAVAMDPSGNYDWDSPTLHSCFRASDFPYALLERAMKRFGDDFSKADARGNYPLHVVAGMSGEDDPEENFLTSIAMKYMEAAKCRNADGKLPLHLAIESRSWDAGIAEMLEIFPAPETFTVALGAHVMAKASREGKTTIVFQLLRNQIEFFTYWGKSTNE